MQSDKVRLGAITDRFPPMTPSPITPMTSEDAQPRLPGNTPLTPYRTYSPSLVPGDRPSTFSQIVGITVSGRLERPNRAGGPRVYRAEENTATRENVIAAHLVNKHYAKKQQAYGLTSKHPSDGLTHIADPAWQAIISFVHPGRLPRWRRYSSTTNPQLKGVWPQNRHGLPFRWLEHKLELVKPIWHATTQLRVVLDELRRVHPAANPTGGRYGVHRAQIVTRNHRILVSALLIPKP